MTALAWAAAARSAGPGDDQETDLAAIGSPGGACWAWVAPDGWRWAWGVYTSWRWEDIDGDPAATLARGPAASEAEAKAAVQAWVDARDGTP